MERMLSLADAFLDEHLEEKASNEPEFKVLVEMTLEDLKTIVEMTKAARKETAEDKDKELATVNYILGQNAGFVDGYRRALGDANEELAGCMAEWQDADKTQDIIYCFTTLGEYLKERKIRMQNEIDKAGKEGYIAANPSMYLRPSAYIKSKEIEKGE
jgi:hypothetical protein